MEKLNQMTLIWSNFQVLSGQNSQSWLLPHSQTTASALVGQHTVLSILLEISNMWGISQSPDLDMYPHCIPTVCGEMLLVCTSPLFMATSHGEKHELEGSHGFPVGMNRNEE